jgi:phenylalanine-4-hydroxylase
MYSSKDFELYEAIRELSILKEMADPDPQNLKKQKNVSYFARRTLEILQKWHY